MNTVTKYLIYGPPQTLRRMPEKLFEIEEPKYLYQYRSTVSGDEIYVSVYEQYEKQMNATITLTCILECNREYNRIEMKKAGGRMGFRGSSLTEDKNIEAIVADFVMDYAKRFGLTIQEEVEKKAPAPSETAEE
ncbi:MAG: hypothetical protein EA360_11855 [Balneolaceae bacterium]|nr:MAG: hypothetical protein EA360_11855 [Balneolaceae bacterium]